MVIKVTETDTVEGIARKYGVSAAKILAYNDCEDIAVGMRLVIPPRGKTVIASHTDSYAVLAVKLGVSEKALREANGNSAIFPGQSIIVP